MEYQQVLHQTTLLYIVLTEPLFIKESVKELICRQVFM